MIRELLGQSRRVGLLIAGRRSQRPPQVLIETDFSLPGWVVRIAAAILGFVCLALVVNHPAQGWIASAIIARMTIRPAGAASTMLVVGAGFALLASEAAVFTQSTFVLLLALHLLVELSLVTGELAWSGRVELSVLARMGRRLLAIQLFAQTLAVGAAWIATHEVEMAWLQTLAGLALVSLAGGVVVRVRRGMEPARSTFR